MTEAEAQDWMISNLGVSRETLAQLDQFRALVLEEASQQNLISAATIPHFWVRHIVDSAQLLIHAKKDGPWLDLGTGAGFPGIVIALLRQQPITLVESRRRRVDFLNSAVNALGVDHVCVQGTRLEHLPTSGFAVISARAFAPLPKLLAMAMRFSRKDTIWVLPKGKSSREELETLPKAWQGLFHVKPSITDAEASILLGLGIEPVGRR